MLRHNLMRKVRPDGRAIAATEFPHLSIFQHLIYPVVAEVVVVVAAVEAVVVAVVVVDAADAVNIYRRHYRLDL